MGTRWRQSERRVFKVSVLKELSTTKVKLRRKIGEMEMQVGIGWGHR